MKKWLLALVACLGLIVMLVPGPGAVLADGDNSGGFLLGEGNGGTARHAFDPENPANEVIKTNLTLAPGQCVPTTIPPYQNCPFGTVSRHLGVKIHELDNMLEFKAYFASGLPGRSCGGGSPRFQLAIDLDGDGVSNGNAFGYYGAPSTVGCPPNIWKYEDFTDLILRWDLSQLAGTGEIFPPPPFQVSWDVAEILIGAFPNHVVCSGALVDDIYFASPAGQGDAYYDVISIGDETWTEFADTAGRGFARGCGPAEDEDDGGDDDDDGDSDHDGDDDDDDDKWNDRRGDDDD
jgi:hypothetical protein